MMRQMIQAMFSAISEKVSPSAMLAEQISRAIVGMMNSSLKHTQ